MKSCFKFLLAISLLSISLLLNSCKEEASSNIQEVSTVNQKENERSFLSIMNKHLNAVSARDLKSLESTLAPDGQVQLIVPKTEIIESTDGFMDFHVGWFADTTWTFETKILNTNVGRDVGYAIVEAVYREKERDGVPYFNRQIISYDLAKQGGNWYIVKDHCTSVEKSTDQ